MEILKVSMIEKNLKNLNKILRSGDIDLEKISLEINKIKDLISFLSEEDKRLLLQKVNKLLKTVEYKQSVIQDNITKLKQKSQVEAKYYGGKKAY